MNGIARMGAFDHLEAFSKTLARAVALVGLAGLLCLAFATVLDVLLTWLYDYPIVGVRDASTVFVAIVIAASLPVCTAERRHITIMFSNMILNKRLQKLVEIFAHSATLLIFYLMAWQLWLHTNELSRQNEFTMVLEWPVAPWWRIVSLIMAACVLIQAIVLITVLRETLSKEQ